MWGTIALPPPSLPNELVLSALHLLTIDLFHSLVAVARQLGGSTPLPRTLSSFRSRDQTRAKTADGKSLLYPPKMYRTT